MAAQEPTDQLVDLLRVYEPFQRPTTMRWHPNMHPAANNLSLAQISAIRRIEVALAVKSVPMKNLDIIRFSYFAQPLNRPFTSSNCRWYQAGRSSRAKLDRAFEALIL